MKILKAIFGTICILLLSFVLQFNAAGARLENKLYMSIVRDSGYYALYNATNQQEEPKYVILGLDKAK